MWILVPFFWRGGRGKATFRYVSRGNIKHKNRWEEEITKMAAPYKMAVWPCTKSWISHVVCVGISKTFFWMKEDDKSYIFYSCPFFLSYNWKAQIIFSNLMFYSLLWLYFFSFSVWKMLPSIKWPITKVIQ